MEIKYKSNLVAGIVSIILQLMVSHQGQSLGQSEFYGLDVVWFC